MREHHRRLVDFLVDAGAAGVRIEHDGRHPRILYRWRGQDCVYPVAGTPSDVRAGANAITELRHRLGLVAGEKRTGERRERRQRNRSTDATLPPPVAIPGDDWRDTLAAWMREEEPR